VGLNESNTADVKVSVVSGSRISNIVSEVEASVDVIVSPYQSSAVIDESISPSVAPIFCVQLKLSVSVVVANAAQPINNCGLKPGSVLADVPELVGVVIVSRAKSPPPRLIAK
jgi:hypothetical protein